MARLELFAKDMDPGIRRFCSRYTVDKIPKDPAVDTVSLQLQQHWEDIGYGIELMRPHGWLYAPGVHRMQPKMNARLAMLFHDRYTPESLRGVIYRVTVLRGNIDRWPVDAEGIFNATRRVHRNIIHIILSATGDELSVTIPAVLGAERVAEVAGVFLRAGLDATYHSANSPPERNRLAWPEYVLWPDHMLTFFSEETHEPIIQLPDA